MNGILNLYKNSGMTSQSAVSRARRILGEKTVGHMGTLDPAGEGVLLLGVGKGARLFDYFLKKDKEYEADFTFGYETDTLDGDGKVTSTSDYIPSKEQIEENLAKLVGEYEQMPPQYSAKSVGGVRAYDLARQGKSVELKTAKITVISACVLDFCAPKARVKIHCSSGTYIRSICRDLAALCGSKATMTAIKRTRCGVYLSQNAVTLEELEQSGEKSIISLSDALKDLRQISLPCEFKRILDNGIKIDIERANIGQIEGDFALFCDNVLYGIASVIGGRIAIKTYLKD